jgi:hypothetical protein
VFNFKIHSKKNCRWVNLILFCAALCLAAFSILITYSHHSELNLKAFFFIDIILPLLALFLTTAIFIFSEHEKKLIVLSLLSIVVTVYLVNAVWIYEYSDVTSRRFLLAAKHLHAPYDKRTKLEVVRDLKLKNPQSTVYPVIASATPIKVEGVNMMTLGQVANAIVVANNESGEYLVYRTDEHGFHNQTGIWAQKKIDIVCIGDSFTLGEDVPSCDNFVSLIANVYPNTLNLGQGGYGPLSELGILREYVRGVKPKIVLWAYFEANDLDDLNKEVKMPLLTEYLDKDFRQDLIQKQSSIDREKERFINDFYTKAHMESFWNADRKHEFLDFIQLKDIRRKLGWHFAPPPTAVNLKLFTKILEAAKAEVSSWGGKLYFVYLPSWENFGNPSLASPHRSEVLSITKDLEIPLIDVLPKFKTEKDPFSLFPFGINGHYNVKGYRLVSEVVLEKLAADNFTKRTN